MNTNGIDLYLNFLQGDLWTFIAKEEPSALCVLNSLKWWKSCTEALQFCHRLNKSVSVLILGVPLEEWLCGYNDTQVDCGESESRWCRNILFQRHRTLVKGVVG